MKAIHVLESGGPEKMVLVDVLTPSPGPKQALIRLKAIGVNFIDVYFRKGLYKADVPIVLGNEGAGTVEAIGPEVTEVAVGDRVAWAMHRGSYAEYSVVPAAVLVKTPDGVDFQMAAAARVRQDLFGSRRGWRHGQPDRANG
jgi:NADPH2:quinone reductase